MLKATTTTIYSLDYTVIANITDKLDYVTALRARCAWTGFANVINLGKVDSYMVVHSAASCGHLDMLKALHAKGRLVHTDMIAYGAASGGHLSILQWAYERGLKFSPDVVETAVPYPECIKWLLDEGYKADEEAMCRAVSIGNLESVRLMRAAGTPHDLGRLAHSAVANNRLEILKYLLNEGCMFTESHLSEAAAYGNIECMEFIWNMVRKVDEYGLYHAVFGKNIDIVEWMHTQGAVIDGLVINAALRSCTPEIREWGHRNNHGRAKKNIAIHAPAHGISVLKWFHQRGYAIPAKTWNVAIEYEDIDCMHYLRVIGCPVSETAIVEAMQAYSAAPLKMLVEQMGMTIEEPDISIGISLMNAECAEYAMSKLRGEFDYTKLVDLVAMHGGIKTLKVLMKCKWRYDFEESMIDNIQHEHDTVCVPAFVSMNSNHKTEASNCIYTCNVHNHVKRIKLMRAAASSSKIA